MKRELQVLGMLVVSVAILLFVLTSLAHAGGVTDNNDGLAGQILVSTGDNHGGNSIGEWTSSDFLKGEKGDTGEQGIQGIPGIDGINGVDGIAGINGTDGLDGLNGINGIDGAPGVQGTAGNGGKDGLNGADGKDGEKGDKGDRGEKGKSFNSQTNYEFETELQFIREKNITVGVYGKTGTYNEIGAKVTIGIGKSYQDRVNEKNELKQRELQEQIYETKADLAVFKAEHK